MIIENNTYNEIEINKSKFITYLYIVKNKTEFLNYFSNLKNKYKDATHICYAYIIDNEIRFDEAKEPSGTAGAPIMNILQKNELCNILVIVTRYFGVILLGTGGLVRAYSKAAQDAIDKLEIVNKIKGIKYKIFVNYENQKDALYWCKKLNIEVLNIKYDNLIELNLQSTIENKENLLNNIKQEKDYEIVEENVYILDKNL